MINYENLQSASDEWIESQLTWMEKRQADSLTCSAAGEDRSYKIHCLEQEKKDRIHAGMWNLKEKG